MVTKNLTDSKQKGIGELAIRIGISHHIKSQDVIDVIPNAAEVELVLREPNEDAFHQKKK